MAARGNIARIGADIHDAGGLAVHGHPTGDALAQTQSESAASFAEADGGFNFKKPRFGVDQHHGTRCGTEHPDRVDQREFENDPGIER